MRKTDRLGKCTWSAKTNKESAWSTNGVEDCWRDINATTDDLIAALGDRPETYTYFYCEQWQKVGRKIDLVKVKEIQL